MIESDPRNDTSERILDHVGGIKSTAHSRFKNDYVASFSLEKFKSDAGYKLKLGGLFGHLFGKGADVFGYLGQLPVGDIFAHIAHTLVEDTDVGGGIKSRFIALGA